MSDKKDNTIYLHGNDAKITHTDDVAPRNVMLNLTDNKTTKDGNVINKMDEDAWFSKINVDMNKK